ncbi:MAG: hypothetical protein PHP44_11070 [Kiritimatiellae bacterium]|nr:hypothetical protein [Kiritimatiellia bacterium]
MSKEMTALIKALKNAGYKTADPMPGNSLMLSPGDLKHDDGGLVALSVLKELGASCREWRTKPYQLGPMLMLYNITFTEKPKKESTDAEPANTDRR